MKMRRYTMNDNKPADPLCNLCDCIFSEEEGRICEENRWNKFRFENLPSEVQAEIKRREAILYESKGKFALLNFDARVIDNICFCPVCGRKL